MRLLVHDMLVNVNGIYYVHVWEQARWAHSVGNSAIENVCIIVIWGVGGDWITSCLVTTVIYSILSCFLVIFCTFIRVSLVISGVIAAEQGGVRFWQEHRGYSWDVSAI